MKSAPLRLVINLLVVYVAYFVCRVMFVAVNHGSFPEAMNSDKLVKLFLGGMHFDTSAICYSNVIFIFLYLFSAYFRSLKRWFERLLKWLYVGVNGLCVLIDLSDTVFFSFRLQRTTSAIFTEFGGEGNLMTIAGTEILSHWYLLLVYAVIVFGFIKLYRKPCTWNFQGWGHYAIATLSIIAAVYLVVSGMRGAFLFTKATRPISINYSFQYTDNATETGIVLNTPFSILRTSGRTMPPTPKYFESREAAEAIYTPVHLPLASNDSTRLSASSKKNIVILILESFATEFIGKFNHHLDNGTYKGYTPHLDALIDSCLWYDEMIANTFYSIDAPPAVLASIPRASNPFLVSPHSVNHINSLASELKNMGYNSAFFHGADDSSLGISAFINQAGFDNYYGKTEFYADGRFGGKEEFDGTWGIWDEPFLQFFCAKLGEMKEPFLGSVFTLSSHHPFKVPEKYRDVFTDEGIFPLHKAVKYSDYAVHQFFETARKQPWFRNTIFVICADHTSSKRTHDEYKKNAMGNFRIPVLIYDPSGELPRGHRKGLIQQIDIMPTLLNYLGYDHPYVAFGKDVFNTPENEMWAFNWNDLPTYIKGDYMMVLNGDKITGFYNYIKDPYQQDNLLGKGLREEKDMELHLKAIVQSYLDRMNNDDVIIKKDN